jgi:hypothetical protein
MLIFVSKFVITLFLGNCVVRLASVYYEDVKEIFPMGIAKDYFRAADDRRFN